MRVLRVVAIEARDPATSGHSFRVANLTVALAEAVDRADTREFSVAVGHHEKLNGQGYPNRLSAPDIPIQTRMMTIADIFDALSASDRPYKKAVPVERALTILEFAVKDGELDPDLFKLFLDARVFDRWQVEPHP